VSTKTIAAGFPSNALLANAATTVKGAVVGIVAGKFALERLEGNLLVLITRLKAIQSGHLKYMYHEIVSKIY